MKWFFISLFAVLCFGSMGQANSAWNLFNDHGITDEDYMAEANEGARKLFGNIDDDINEQDNGIRDCYSAVDNKVLVSINTNNEIQLYYEDFDCPINDENQKECKVKNSQLGDELKTLQLKKNSIPIRCDN